jgi:UDP-GlcNAc:undecaprenyl-phosphate GlcNAc-1-phosphate transferase
VANNLLTIFWLVGITNAVNLLDNMDGLAGGVSLIACLFLMLAFLLNGQAAEAVLPAMLGGAVLGFLVYNFLPASIFMGDCGSLFLGFMLGGAALLSDYDRSRHLLAVLFTPALIMLIPIFDISVVTVTRRLSGRPASQGGRDHTSHRLVTLDLSEQRAVLLLCALATCSGALALGVRLLEVEIALLLVPGFALMVLFLGIYLGRVRIHDDTAPHPAGHTLLTALVEFSYKRRMFEVLLDVVLVALAYYGAYLLRWDADMPAQQPAVLVQTLPLIIALQMLGFLVCGVYRGLWRYTGLDDLLVLAKAVLTGSAVCAGVVFALYGWQGPSRAVFILDALLLFVFVGASRVSFRLLRALLGERAPLQFAATPVVIYGAGDGGELLIREILNNPDLGYAPVGFIDDDHHKVGRLIHGCRIFERQALPDLIRTRGVREVLVSSLKVADSQLTDLRPLGVNLRRMTVRIQ